ncbi:hydrolase [Leptospira kobayashii]|uniref:Hydrolase n=1 Tax=Leptospira kobayashii TaxID=1917830 RepID=A0ABM7UHM6_9LEPT|nr:amidohydrolase family protein [Leptospira kobayashii]BDA78176.1 hydrolase [Leptospira kobayashii]
MSSWTISNAQVFQNGKLADLDLKLEGNQIDSLQKRESFPGSKPDSRTFDFKNKKVYPGFFNSHDHLLASYLPKIGGTTKHNSWLAYDNLYKSSGVFAERQQLDSELLYYLGAYKNLLAGVTSVHDHIPHSIQKPFVDILPIRLLSEFTLAHSVGNYSLSWGEGPALEYKLAEASNLPFVTHLGEGLDEDSLSSLKKLEKMDALGPHSVLIHCLPFGPREVERIAKANASVVWCPGSNLHIFGKTTNIKLFMDAGVNVCLGTDFSPSGSLHILEELKLAKSLFQDLYEEELPESTLLKWVTENPAQAFRKPTLGSIKEGQIADLVVINDGTNASEISISQLGWDNVDLVIIDGMPVYGSSAYKKLFSELGIESELISVKGSEKIVAGSPKALLDQVSSSVGYKKDLAFLPIL